MMGNKRRLWLAFILLAFLSINCSLARPIIERVRSGREAIGLASADEQETRRQRLTPRPTFTSTPDYTATPTNTPSPTITPIPTETPTPPPTNTPVPTDTPPPPTATNTPVPQPPTATFTPAPTPTPDYLFRLQEQGNREFQKTNHHTITIYVAAVDANNIPIGGLKMVGDHVPSGKHAESPPSDGRWSVANCVSCDYIKQGNMKFEPGTFQDGTWNIYLADGNGSQLSEIIPLSYSSDPQQWVWDFLILTRKN